MRSFANDAAQTPVFVTVKTSWDTNVRIVGTFQPTGNYRMVLARNAVSSAKVENNA